MARPTDARRRHLSLRIVARCAALCVALAAGARPGAAQIEGSLFERLNLDRLRLRAIGMSYGAINPSEMVGTQSYSMYADYGEIADRWRVVFSATFWATRYTDEVVDAFARRFRASIIDPSADDTLRAERIDVSDISLNAELRFAPWRTGMWRPYLGGGGGFHVLNAEGRYIADTFVEQSLDNIAAGLAGVAGIDVVLFRRLTVGSQVRYELLSGTRYGSLRIAGSYLLDRQPPVHR